MTAPTAERGPSVENAAALAALEAREPQTMATKGRGRPPEWHQLFDLLPVATVHLHAVFKSQPIMAAFITVIIAMPIIMAVFIIAIIAVLLAVLIAGVIITETVGVALGWSRTHTRGQSSPRATGAPLTGGLFSWSGVA